MEWCKNECPVAGSNRWPSDYETDAITNLANQAFLLFFAKSRTMINIKISQKGNFDSLKNVK